MCTYRAVSLRLFFLFNMRVLSSFSLRHFKEKVLSTNVYIQEIREALSFKVPYSLDSISSWYTFLYSFSRRCWICFFVAYFLDTMFSRYCWCWFVCIRSSNIMLRNMCFFVLTYCEGNKQFYRDILNHNLWNIIVITTYYKQLLLLKFSSNSTLCWVKYFFYIESFFCVSFFFWLTISY